MYPLMLLNCITPRPHLGHVATGDGGGAGVGEGGFAHAEMNQHTQTRPMGLAK